MLVLFLIVALIWIWFQLGSDNVREWAATKVGSAVDRRVTIKEPLGLAFLPTPTIVIHQLSIAGHSGDSSDFITADTIEISIALRPLIRGSIVISRLVLAGVTIVLDKDEGARLGRSDKNLHDDAVTSAPPISPVEIRELVLRDVTLHDRRSDSPGGDMLSLREGKVEIFPNLPIRLIANGEFRKVPVRVEAMGGTLSDLIRGREFWPVDVVIRAVDATLELKGSVALPFGTSRADVQVTLACTRLSALNQLLAVTWPSLGPYRISGEANLGVDEIAVSNVQAVLGSSDLTGDAFIHFDHDHPRWSMNLASKRIDLHDFVAPENSGDAPPGEDAESAMKLIDGLKAHDASIHLTAETVIIGTHTLESVGLEATLTSGDLRLLLHGADAFGARFEGHAKYDVAAKSPSGSVFLSGHAMDIGMMLRSFGLANGVLGVADVTIKATGKGATQRAVMDSLVVTADVSKASFLLPNLESGNDIELGLSEAHLSMTLATAGELALAGHYGHRRFRIDARTGSLSELLSNHRWPIRVALHGDRAHLIVDGVIDRPLEGEGVALTVRGDLPDLHEWDPSLSALGPFRLSGKLIAQTPRSWSSNFVARLRGTDIGGLMDVAFAGDRIAVRAHLTSRNVRTDDFMDQTPRVKESGGSTPPPNARELAQVLQRFVADVEWRVERFRAGRYYLEPFVLRLTVDRGKVEASWSSMTNQPVINTASVGLDVTGVMPKLSSRIRLQKINYGRLLSRMGITGQVVGTGHVDISLDSEGWTKEDLLERVVIEVTAKSHTIRIGMTKGFLLAVDRAELKLGGRPQDSMNLSVRGETRGLPLSLGITTIPLRQLLESTHEVPFRLVARAPDLMLEVEGQVGTEIARGTANFTVSLEGSSLVHLGRLVQINMPDLGPFTVAGRAAVRGRTIGLSGLHATVGNSDVTGRMEASWMGSRPRVEGIVSSELIEVPIIERRADVLVASERTKESLPQAMKKGGEEAAATAHSIGKEVKQFVDPFQLERSKGPNENTRLIPEWVLPVESLRSADLDVQWTVNRLSAPPVEFHDVVGMLALKDGMLTLGPISLVHDGAVTTGLLTMDGTRDDVPTRVEITTTHTNYGGLFNAFRITDKVEGSADIHFISQGNGRTLREQLAHVNGHLEIVAGPARLATRYVELWANNLMTVMLSQAWQRQEFTQYHCAAGSFDILNGKMKAGALLIDGTDHTIVAAGMLALDTEEVDFLVTPRPKDVALLSLAVPIRLTGRLASPQVSTKANSIAASKAWEVLHVADPLGLTLSVPHVILADNAEGTASPDKNPCIVALSQRGKGPFSTEKVVRTGFEWLAEQWRRAGSAVGRLLGVGTTVPAR